MARQKAARPATVLTVNRPQIVEMLAGVLGDFDTAFPLFLQSKTIVAPLAAIDPAVLTAFAFLVLGEARA
jgi:hypothetical protein